MMAHTHTGKTPFCLAFGSEVVIPTEVGLTSYRVAYHVKGRNEEGIHLQLDLLDEVKATTEQWITCYQDLMAKHYHTKVRPRHLKIGPHPEESNDSCQRPHTGQVESQLGRTLQDRGLPYERHLPLRDARWTKNALPLECRAPKEILLIVPPGATNYVTAFSFFFFF